MSLNIQPDLLQITKSNLNGTEANSVNARDIYDYLKIKTAFTTWIQRAIEKYDFIENVDYISLSNLKPSGQTEKVFIVSIDMAKELCLIESNQIGKETRKYFINIEKQANKPLTIERLLEENTKVIQKLKLENKSHVQFISNVVHSENSYTATQVAKDLNISAKLLNKILIESKVIYKNNNTYALTSRYQNFDLTEIKETQPNQDGKTFLSLRWTVKGKNWLKNNFNKALQRCEEDTFNEYNKQILSNLPDIPMPKKSERNF